MSSIKFQLDFLYQKKNPAKAGFIDWNIKLINTKT